MTLQSPSSITISAAEMEVSLQGGRRKGGTKYALLSGATLQPLAGKTDISVHSPVVPTHAKFTSQHQEGAGTRCLCPGGNKVPMQTFCSEGKM